MSNYQINKLKSAIKNGTEVTLNLSSNLIRSSNYKTNFPHKLLLTNTQVSKIRQGFTNGLSANVTFSKTQLPKIVQIGGSLFGPPILPEVSSLTDPIINSFLKEFKNIATRN